MSSDETRMNDDSLDETRMTPHAPAPLATHGSVVSSQSGWLNSSGSVDHGRFAPGTMLDNRYRVLGLLGRGGMGEVYRADDLRLGQQVALKFLPETLSVDARRLAQFHNEVRTARQVSHPNVCRVYDIGEIVLHGGQSLMFLTMEYVDGEDLSILLRRIGRLPEERAIEIARQICAGLSAAHERGILHRDLKPANIMLDGAGRVRIMDFSLAAVGQVDDVRAGTPAYMAPEQLSGLEVTVRSDVYALGLVLYEVFTGRRAFDAKTIADLVAQHQSGSITSPAQLVPSLDQAVDRAIMRCLEPLPASRPPSALAVAAALPGGDPLAAAIAAGETPSPEMVAAAGGQGATISAAAGGAVLVLLAVIAFLGISVAQRTSIYSYVPITKPVEVLIDRAQEIRRGLGYEEPVADQERGFASDSDYVRWLAEQKKDRGRWNDLRAGRPSALLFWYRTGPAPLIPRNPLQPVTPTDPPLLINGMTLVTLDTSGRLVRFYAAPPQVETPPPSTPPIVDWDKAFTAAGIDRNTLTDAAPGRTPSVFADEQRAWRGVLPGTEIPVTVEAAAYRGRVVSFDLVMPWSSAPRDTKTAPRSTNGNPYFVFLLLVCAAWAARANIVSGRADRKGAFRIGAFMVLILMMRWIVDGHVIDMPSEQQRSFATIGISLFIGGAMYLIYLGLEPFMRRSSPSVLIGWSRVLAGRFRDPLVGRDMLIGVTAGAAVALFNLLPFVIAGWNGTAGPPPFATNSGVLLGARGLVSDLMQSLNSALQNSLITVFEWIAVRRVVEWLWLKSVSRFTASPRPPSENVIAALFVLVPVVIAYFDAEPQARTQNALLQFLTLGMAIVVILRVGLFGSTIASLVTTLLMSIPMTFDAAKLYAPGSWFVLALIAAMAVFGYWAARSGDHLPSATRFRRT